MDNGKWPNLYEYLCHRSGDWGTLYGNGPDVFAKSRHWSRYTFFPVHSLPCCSTNCLSMRFWLAIFQIQETLRHFHRTNLNLCRAKKNSKTSLHQKGVFFGFRNCGFLHHLCLCFPCNQSIWQNWSCGATASFLWFHRASMGVTLVPIGPVFRLQSVNPGSKFGIFVCKIILLSVQCSLRISRLKSTILHCILSPKLSLWWEKQISQFQPTYCSTCLRRCCFPSGIWFAPEFRTLRSPARSACCRRSTACHLQVRVRKWQLSECQKSERVSFSRAHLPELTPVHSFGLHVSILIDSNTQPCVWILNCETSFCYSCTPFGSKPQRQFADSFVWHSCTEPESFSKPPQFGQPFHDDRRLAKVVLPKRRVWFAFRHGRAALSRECLWSQMCTCVEQQETGTEWSAKVCSKHERVKDNLPSFTLKAFRHLFAIHSISALLCLPMPCAFADFTIFLLMIFITKVGMPVDFENTESGVDVHLSLTRHLQINGASTSVFVSRKCFRQHWLPTSVWARTKQKPYQ